MPLAAKINEESPMRLLKRNRDETRLSCRTRGMNVLTASVITFTLTSAVCASANSLGRDWEGDSNDDAGDKPSTAQKVELDTFDDVKTIKGELKGENGGLAGLGDYQDCYIVAIKQPGRFSIQTTAPFGSTEFDSLLCVYTLDGRALLANEDAKQGQGGSRVGNQSTNGEFVIDKPGSILISISGANSLPVDAAGNLVFSFNDDATDVVGPSKAGLISPFDAWTQPGQTGNYVIELNAVGPIPSACAVENTSSCFIVHPLPYCNDPACCVTTCTVEPFCCDVTWDATCVEVAEFLCGEGETGCGTNAAESCYEPHDSAYCNDPVCCALVCEQRPECCTEGWDADCVALAEAICTPPCNFACPEDLNFDGVVSGPDLAIVLGSWAQTGCADLDGSGQVDGPDITIVLGAWGNCNDQ
jgi:hypothetical protein